MHYMMCDIINQYVASTKCNLLYVPQWNTDQFLQTKQYIFRFFKNVS